MDRRLRIDAVPQQKQPDDEWMSTHQVVRYDEASSDVLSPITRSDRSTARSRRKNKRWSPSSSSSTSSSSVQPRAELTFPLQWNATETTSSSSLWPVLLRWDRRRSRITTSATLPLYKSQDALMEHSDHHHQNTGVSQRKNNSHRQELVCKVSMTTLQRNFFQDEGLLGSISLKATHYQNDNDSDDRKKTSLILTANRQRNDVVSLSLEHSGKLYAVSAIMAANAANGGRESSSPFLRLRAHYDYSSSSSNLIFFHRRWLPVIFFKIRPDVTIVSSSSNYHPAAGITIMHDDSRKQQHTARSLGNVRFGCTYTDRSWNPTVRVHWSYPFWGSFHWQGTGGGASSSAIQYEASWKATTHHHHHQRSNFQLSVATQDMFQAVAWKYIISFTLSDVTIRLPIIIAAANTWQRHMLYWGLASVVSHLVHGIVQDVFGRKQHEQLLQLRKKQQSNNPNPGSVGRHTALMQQHFMKRQADLRYRDEAKRNGLLIESALYRYQDVMLDVTIPLRFWVTDSKLELFGENKRSFMLGFYNLEEDIALDEDGHDDDNDDAMDAAASRKQNTQTTKTRLWALVNAVVQRCFPIKPFVSSTDHQTARKREGSILEICYRFDGNRYTIFIRDDEHVLLPSPRAKAIAD